MRLLLLSPAFSASYFCGFEYTMVKVIQIANKIPGAADEVAMRLTR